jgi:hypothetical protein
MADRKAFAQPLQKRIQIDSAIERTKGRGANGLSPLLPIAWHCEHILSARARPHCSSGLGLLSSAKLDDVASSRTRTASLTIIFHLPIVAKNLNSRPNSIEKDQIWMADACRQATLDRAARTVGQRGADQRASKPAASSRVCMRLRA